MFSKRGLFFLVVLLVGFLMVVSNGLGAGSIVNARGFVFGFEDGQTGGWYPRGSEVKLEVVKGESHSGEYSLLTTGRNQNWNGPSVNIQDQVKESTKYEISAWVKLASQPVGELIMTVEKNKGNDTSWDRVAGPIEVNNSEWVKLSGEYTIPEGFERLTLYIESPDKVLEYYVDDVVAVQAGEVVQRIEEDIPSLAGKYEDIFLVGAAVEPYQLQGEHAKLLSKHFNGVTAENAMKPQPLHPEENTYNFEPADRIIKFAEKNGLKVRGHTLLWHKQVPQWFFEDKAGKAVAKEVLLQRLKNHIQTVVKRYKGKVYAWDVVNEVIDPASTQTDGLRNTRWLQIIGKDYIAKAFEYAHQADPAAKLFINDYNTYQPAKRDLIYNLVKDLKEEGVPVHGIGMQLHINLNYPSLYLIEEAIKKFASLGVEIHITELDMPIADSNQTFEEPPEELLIKQGHRYKELFDLFKKYADVITSVTFWGMADDHTWRGNWPLPFDEGLKAKYAYWGLVEPDSLPAYVEEKEEKSAKIARAIQGTPVIDGKMDKIWENANVIKTDVWVSSEKGATAKVRTMWDEKHLYIYAEVTDRVLSMANTNPWEQDSVEIFVDENNHKTTHYEGDDSQYRVNFANETSFNPNPAREGFVTATGRTDQGYIVEAAIEFVSIKAAPGKTIGFDFQVNDDQGDGKRTSIVKWNDPTDNSYKDTSGFGNLEFVK